MFPVSLETPSGPNFGQYQGDIDGAKTGFISEQELMKLGESIVDGTGDHFAILHTICARFGITPNSLSIDPLSQSQSDPSLFIHLFSALFSFLPNSTNFHLLPLFTTILQRHPPSLPHLLSSPLWLSLPSILASPPQHLQSSQSPQSPSTLQTQQQPSSQNEHQIGAQSHLRPVLAFVNSILQLCLSSSPPTPIPNKTLLSSSLSTLSSHPDPLVNANSSFSLILLNKIDCVGDETSMPMDELVAQRDALRVQIAENEREITKLTEKQDQMTEAISAKDTTINTLTNELHEIQTETEQKDDAINTLTQHLKEKDDSFRTKDQIINEKVAQMKQKDERIAEKDDTIRSKDQTINEKDNSIKQKDELIAKQAATIAEQMTKIGELVAMEKRLTDMLSTTHSKVVAVEAQVIDAAKDVKWIRGMIPPEHAITIWDPTHYQKEGRRITSLVEKDKACFSDEITRGVWRLSLRCGKSSFTTFGVIESSQLEQSKTSNLTDKQGSSAFILNLGWVVQNGNETADGNQHTFDDSVVTLELDMNRHTLVLFVDSQRQPHSLANIPQKVRLALCIWAKDNYADILSFEEISAQTSCSSLNDHFKTTLINPILEYTVK
ncbi:hypothetical protein BLNAU_16473 [Blattamonas nauphoetae]|uniref:Uncharacterized protein n=1 Tax=Blattamonas nauphoetae TaxID=2049346 RepID=A0ABQ9XA64_9EUKA|nr:hypothetical protein BLNAU_16473 [Blattamonas nauphoetae]